MISIRFCCAFTISGILAFGELIMFSIIQEAKTFV